MTGNRTPRKHCNIVIMVQMSSRSSIIQGTTTPFCCPPSKLFSTCSNAVFGVRTSKQSSVKNRKECRKAQEASVDNSKQSTSFWNQVCSNLSIVPKTTTSVVTSMFFFLMPHVLRKSAHQARLPQSSTRPKILCLYAAISSSLARETAVGSRRRCSEDKAACFRVQSHNVMPWCSLWIVVW